MSAAVDNERKVAEAVAALERIFGQHVNVDVEAHSEPLMQTGRYLPVRNVEHIDVRFSVRLEAP